MSISRFFFRKAAKMLLSFSDMVAAKISPSESKQICACVHRSTCIPSLIGFVFNQIYDYYGFIYTHLLRFSFLLINRLCDSVTLIVRRIEWCVDNHMEWDSFRPIPLTSPVSNTLFLLLSVKSSSVIDLSFASVCSSMFREWWINCFKYFSWMHSNRFICIRKTKQLHNIYRCLICYIYHQLNGFDFANVFGITWHCCSEFGARDSSTTRFRYGKPWTNAMCFHSNATW